MCALVVVQVDYGAASLGDLAARSRSTGFKGMHSLVLSDPPCSVWAVSTRLFPERVIRESGKRETSTFLATGFLDAGCRGGGSHKGKSSQ